MKIIKKIVFEKNPIFNNSRVCKWELARSNQTGQIKLLPNEYRTDQIEQLVYSGFKDLIILP